MNLRTHRARTAGAVAAVLAAGTTVGLALTAGNAVADEPGRCTRNVNVRQDPDAASRIVALCRAGSAVALGEERDGFVRIPDLDGWASREFVTGTAHAADTADDPADPADPAVDAATRDAGSPLDDVQVAGNRVSGAGSLLG